MESPDQISLFADEEKLTMVISTLLDNALKYTLRGKIEIKVIDVGQEVIIEIEDTGIGIPDHEKGKVTEPFFRGSHELIQNSDGIGIGCYISERFIALHRGKLTFESEEGRGTKFIIKIPKA